ncbi:MAG: aminotransferase class IV [Candidatus Thermoplasmatota archaeon]|nr:aminotransferase class IV [Candidatus Thermoplasmatota archaeon]
MGGGTPSSHSVFTTLRWKEGQVAWLNEHLKRLEKHAERLGIQWPENFLESLHSSMIHGEGNLCRIQLCKDGEITLTLRESNYSPSPLVATSQEAPRFPANVQGTKHDEWGGYIEARKQSIGKGADIGLLVHDGAVVDGDHCTPILLDRDGVAFAPAPEGGGVDSITLQLLKPAIEASGIPFRTARLTERLIGRASEIIVVGTGVGVAWLNEIDGQEVGKGSPGPLFTVCEKAFYDSLGDAWTQLGDAR